MIGRFLWSKINPSSADVDLNDAFIEEEETCRCYQ